MELEFWILMLNLSFKLELLPLISNLNFEFNSDMFNGLNFFLFFIFDHAQDVFTYSSNEYT